MVAQMFNRAPQRARTATPLLAFIAGDFADAVAQLWPAPHADFFALPAARRHAARRGPPRAAAPSAPRQPPRTAQREGDVVHCYGHGGSGVTLSWGCADHLVQML